MRVKNNISLSNSNVFFDFDNTITHFDVIDDIVERFAQSESWRKFEEDWKLGRIGSRQCLKGQFKEVRIKKNEFIRYLSAVKVDPYFAKILGLLREKGVFSAIVSDSFSFIISYILQNNGIPQTVIYSNELYFEGDRLRLKFPYFNKNCPKCANCKKNHVISHSRDSKASIYIGDGLSDVCPARTCDLVFAKGALAKHLKAQGTDYIEFDNLEVIYNYLKGRDVLRYPTLHEQSTQYKNSPIVNYLKELA
jgi:2,3-diketo-5-methylthio-1-phosphopentane phosphatase